MENSNNNSTDKYIQDRYRNAINYYWSASKNNKKWYKATRSLTVIFGALVTLIASLASSKYFNGNPSLEILFAMGTPILAALLTIIAGFSQSFQWGSTWQNMILTAQHLQREFDKYLVIPENERNYREEAEKLNNFVIAETQGFFERMLGGSKFVDKRIEPKISNDEEEI